MQKKIIALAVAGLMSGAAFAQSNVTISGLLDAGVNNAKGQNLSASNNAAYNNTATSILGFRAVEDLGGGMKAGVYIETNPLGANVAPTGVLGDFQRFIYVNGGFGELSLGQRTNFSTTTATTAQPFGTAMGGGYSGTFARLQGLGFNANGALAGATSGVRDVRAEGSVRYDSPNFNGFTFGLSFKPKNIGATETAASSGHTNLGLNYNKGPLNVSYAYAKINNPGAAGAAAGTSPTSFAAVGACPAGTTGVTVTDSNGDTFDACYAAAGAAGVEQNVKHNLLAANYTFGAFTLYGGYSNSKGNTLAGGDNINSAAWNVAAKWAATGNVDVLFNYLKDNDKAATDADRKLMGLGVDYKFSKRTAAYGRYEQFDTNTNNGAAGKLTTYSVGLRHAF